MSVWSILLIILLILIAIGCFAGGAAHAGCAFLAVCAIYYFWGLDDCDKNPQWNYCLVHFAKKGDFSSVRRGIRQGGDVNAGKNALLKEAIAWRDVSMVRYLVEKNAVIKAKMYLMADKNGAKLVDELIKSKKNYEVALIYGSRENRVSLIDKLLTAKANVNYQDKYGDTALAISVKNKYHALTDMILKYRPEMNVRNKKGETALFYATRNNDLRAVKQLVGRGAKVNVKDNKGDYAVALTTSMDVIAYLHAKKAVIPGKIADMLVDKNESVMEDPRYLKIFYAD